MISWNPISASAWPVGGAFQHLHSFRIREQSDLRRRLPALAQRCLFVSELGPGEITRTQTSTTSPDIVKSRLAGAAHPADRDFFLSDIAGVPGRSPEIIPRQQTVNNLWGYDITRRMQHPVHDEELFMEEALAAIRQAITKEEAGETTLAPAEPRTSREQAGAKPIPRLDCCLAKQLPQSALRSTR